MKPSEKVLINLNKIKEIMLKYKLKNIRVVGSCVRGEDEVDSDIDFLVRDNDPGADIKSAKMELKKLLECPVNVLSEQNLHEPFRTTIYADAVPLEEFQPGCRPPRGRNLKIAKNLFNLRNILFSCFEIKNAIEGHYDYQEREGAIRFYAGKIQTRVTKLKGNFIDMTGLVGDLYKHAMEPLTLESEPRIIELTVMIEILASSEVEELLLEYTPNPDYCVERYNGPGRFGSNERQFSRD